MIGAADQELLDLVEMELRELLTEVQVPRRRHADHPWLGAQGARGGQGRAGSAVDPEADGRVRHVHPGAGARDGQAVPDAGGGRVHDLGPRHGGHGPRRARHHQGGRGSGDRRLPRHAEDGRHRRGDVPQAARPGSGGRQHRRAAARHEARRRRARPGAGQAGLDHAAQEVQGRGLRAEEGGGRPSHAVLQRLPPAVLLPHHRRDRLGQAAGGRRDGDAGRQHQHRRRAASRRSPARKASASPSAKAAAPSAPASSPRSLE